MGTGAEIALFAAAGASVVGTVGSAVSSQRQASEQKDASKRQQQMAELENTRRIRQQIREQRMAAGQIANLGATTGTAQSTGVAGGIASTQSQLAGNVGFFNQMSGLQQEVASAQVNAAEAGAQGAQFAALGNLGSTIFGGVQGYKTLFGGNTSGQQTNG